MDQHKQREIARKGGMAAHQKGTAHEFTAEEARDAGRKGGQQVSANRTHMVEIGRLGGKRSAERRRNKSASRGLPVTRSVEDASPGEQEGRAAHTGTGGSHEPAGSHRAEHAHGNGGSHHGHAHTDGRVSEAQDVRGGDEKDQRHEQAGSEEGSTLPQVNSESIDERDGDDRELSDRSATEQE